MKSAARAVVIGGGVGGCSILYWLTRLGWDDVVLCERAELTSGSTFHSAGLVGQLRGSLSLTKMMMSSVELYRTLGDEVGLETGWREVGSLRIDPRRREATVTGRDLGLRAREFDLLAALARDPGVVLSRDALLEDVWGTDFPGETRTVDVHVGEVRRKLGPDGPPIETVRGVGYRLVPPIREPIPVSDPAPRPAD